VSSDFDDPSPVPIRSARERRRGERRQRVWRALLFGSLWPRRREARRGSERALGAIDWHHPQWLALATLIVALSGVDALLTLMLIERGAYEANPVMRPLVTGSALMFALVKVGLTGGGVVFLTVLARMRAFGRLPVGLALYGVLAAYGALILYELGLLRSL
jgi:hypothetical protein